MSQATLPDGVTVHETEQGTTRTWKDVDDVELVKAILSWPDENAQWAVIVCSLGDAVLVRIEADRLDHFAAMWCSTVSAAREARAALSELRAELATREDDMAVSA